MLEIVFLVGPIFIIIFLGWALHARGFVKTQWVKVLNDFVYFIALPCLIFKSFFYLSWSDTVLNAIGINFLFLSLSAIIVFCILSLLPIPPKVKTSIFLVSIVGNTVYLGFPIIGGFLGENARELSTAIPTLYLVMSIFASIIAIEVWVKKSGKLSAYLRDIAFNPLCVALTAGIVASFLPETRMFDLILTPISLFAATASPIALFNLGAFMYGKFYRHHIVGLLVASTVKLIVLPLGAFVFFPLFGLAKAEIAAGILSAAMPVAVTAFVFSKRYELDTKLVSSGIIITTLLSVITIYFAISFLYTI